MCELEDQTMFSCKEHLQSEVDSVVASKAILVHGPDFPENFSSFLMKFLIQELKDSCPKLYGLIQQLSKTKGNDSDSSITGEELKCVMALCTILNARSSRVRGIQLMMSLMLLARSTSKQVTITMLYITRITFSRQNHAGICMSYKSSWDYLLAFTKEAKLVEKVRSGHWIWSTTRHDSQGMYAVPQGCMCFRFFQIITLRCSM